MDVLNIFCFRRRTQVRMAGKVIEKSDQKEERFRVKKQKFRYSEVQAITNNLDRLVGTGELGSVYLGCLDQDTRVAVKIIPSYNVHRPQQFQSEAELITGVRHKNLNLLFGYCCEGENYALIYNYVANGNLRDRLTDEEAYPFNWEKRLQMAIGAAEGLEYLHVGCKPPVIHGNVTSKSILLNEDLQVQLSDFGLPTCFTDDDFRGSHEPPSLARTFGYHDPLGYEASVRSDVYSFGVVLLEIITGQPAIAADGGKKHIIRRIKPLLENGEVAKIVGPSLQGAYDTNSVLKAVNLAMSCASFNSKERPTMGYAVRELKECLALEAAMKPN